MDPEPAILLAFATPSMERLAAELNAELITLPDLARPDDFESWRERVAQGDRAKRVVVSLWRDRATPGELMTIGEDVWVERFETPFLLWNLALGTAALRCADGGAIVALVQTPAALDSPGWTPEMSIADGVVALGRSLAASEGARGIRVNTVTTPIPFVQGDVIAPTPPLPGFPGTLEKDVAGAIRLFLSSDAAGLTGRVLGADHGRSLA